MLEGVYQKVARPQELLGTFSADDVKVISPLCI